MVSGSGSRILDYFELCSPVISLAGKAHKKKAGMDNSGKKVKEEENPFFWNIQPALTGARVGIGYLIIVLLPFSSYF